MDVADPTPEGNPSQSRTSPAPAKRTGRPVKEERPMFDTLQVTKELRESGFAEPQAEAIVVAFGAIAGNVATKDDLKDFATKDDLKALEEKMATKDDLKNFATKDDLKALEEKLEEKMATKDDLKHFATQADLLKTAGELRQEMNAGFQNMQRFFIQAALGTVTVNIAMVAAIFVVAKYLF